MSEGINPKKEDLGIKINTLEVDYEIEKKKVYTQKNSDSEYTFRTGNQADNKSKYLVSIYHKDFSFKGYLSNTLTKEKIGLFNYGNELKKGDKIVTIGGIYGTVDEIREKYVIIVVDGDVKLRVDKSAIVKDMSDVPAK